MKRVCLMVAAVAVVSAGCGGGGGGSAPPAPLARFTSPTNASVAAIDCRRQRAYVPIGLSRAPDAEVAVLDLSADPDTTDPRLATIDLGHGGSARGAAIAPKQGLALIISGSAAATGFLDEINESDNSLVAGSPFSFPTGGRPLISDGIVFDPRSDKALVSMTSTLATCPGGSTTACTGMAKFDLATNSFGSLIQFDDSVDNFAFDPSAQISLAPSDPIAPVMYAVNANAAAACLLIDDSVLYLDGDAEGAAVDPNTGIWVVGNYTSTEATVINLSGAAFSGSTPPCFLNEAGSPPSNSVNFDPHAGEFLPGAAINPITHQAVLTGARDNQIALVSLPKKRVKVITEAALDSVNSSLPPAPDGSMFEAATLPYSASIDTCHNRVYILDDRETFLAEVDLDKLQHDPGAISTALPPGKCAGTSTTLGCDNGNGVRFFPMPGVM